MKSNEIIIPENMEIVFEHFCNDCDQCEPEIKTLKTVTDAQITDKYRVVCVNSAVCLKARSIAATEKSKEYPFA